MNLTIPTDSLKKLLEDNPEVQLKLQSMACEKIAEELHRKALETIKGNATRDLVKRVLAHAEANLRASWKFPDEAKQVVNELVKRAVEEQKNDAITTVNRRTNELADMFMQSVERRFEKRQAEFTLWAQAEVRKLARDEFVKTLETVRSAT